MDRKDYIGSSDAGDIIRGNWMELWRIKTGRADPPDLSNVFRVQLGRVTEEFHLDWIIPRQDVHLTRRGIKGDDDPIILTLDALGANPGVTLGSRPDEIVDAPNWSAVVEVKHTNARAELQVMLEQYMPQIQHHLWVTGCDRCLFSYIPGNDDPVTNWIAASPAWQMALETEYRKFWAYVLEDTPPPSDIEMLPDTQLGALLDKVKVNEMVRRDVNKDNAFRSCAHDLVAFEDAARAYEKAKKDIKDLMADNESELYSDFVTVKRNKAGSKLITIHPVAKAILLGGADQPKEIS